MTEAELRKTVLDTLSDIAPRGGPRRVAPDKDLTEQLDIGSMDCLNVVIALHEKRGVDIPRPTIPRRELAG